VHPHRRVRRPARGPGRAMAFHQRAVLQPHDRTGVEVGGRTGAQRLPGIDKERWVSWVLKADLGSCLTQHEPPGLDHLLGGGPADRAGQRIVGGVSRPVGRVLCLALPRGDGHPSRAAVAGSLVRSTREHRAGSPQTLAQASRPKPFALLTLLQVGFTEPPQSPAALVVSYTTVSPLPPGQSQGAVCFLWHCPAGRPGLALPTTLPCGARTFLTGPRGPARPPGRLTRTKDTATGCATAACAWRRRRLPPRSCPRCSSAHRARTNGAPPHRPRPRCPGSRP